MTRIDRIAHSNLWSRQRPLESMLLCCGLLVTSIAAPPLGTALPLLAIVLFLIVRSGVPRRLYLQIFFIPFGFLLATLPALFLSFSLEQGVQLIDSAQNNRMVLNLLLRSGISTAILVLMVLTIPATRWMAALNGLGLPSWLGEIILLTYRIIALMATLFLTGYQAQKARLGYHGFRRSVRSMSILVAMLFRRTFVQARRMEVALNARGYEGHLTLLLPLPPMGRWGLFGALSPPLAAGLLGVALDSWIPL
ncbi:MAG: cobalt ECF transporter T component CbiQ [Magnetococcales bacterium]|nr:cobalt ECF transporter T component CbiQ [Magnetococcales bacterium]